MTALDPNLIVKALQEAADFTQRVGEKKDAMGLEQLCNRFQKERLTLKAVRGAAAEEMNQAAIAMRTVLYDDQRNARPGMELLVKEHERIWISFLKAIYPPEFTELDITGYARNEAVQSKVVTYKGDPAGVREIVERSISVTQEYAKAIASGDFSGAYALTDRGLRGWMTYKRFMGDHERAAQEYGGPAVEFLIERLNSILADDAVRKKSNTAAEG